jgi:hypothetical protein
MPTYTFKNTKTGEVKDEFCSISVMEEKVESGKYQQVVSAGQGFISQHGSTIAKTSGDYRNLLTRIKKGAGKNSTITTY